MSLSEFQSHNGAIAAWLPFDAVLGLDMFQSHNGAIAARSGRKVTLPPNNSFNPTMVRLLP